MSEQNRQPEHNRWSEAEARVAEVVARKYPDAQDPEALVEIAKRNLHRLEESPSLKFVEVDVEGQSYKTVEPITSETPGEGLPVSEVIDLMGLGDSHEFEYGTPNPDVNPWYLQTLSNALDKPIEAWLPGRDIVRVQPQEVARV